MTYYVNFLLCLDTVGFSTLDLMISGIYHTIETYGTILLHEQTSGYGQTSCYWQTFCCFTIQMLPSYMYLSEACKTPGSSSIELAIIFSQRVRQFYICILHLDHIDHITKGNSFLASTTSSD